MNCRSKTGALVLPLARRSMLLPPRLSDILDGSDEGRGGASLSDRCDLIEPMDGLEELPSTIRARPTNSAIRRMRDLGFIVISMLRG